MAHSTDFLPTLTAANRNLGGLQTVPVAAIPTLADLLGEVCVARLAAADLDRAPHATSGERAS